MLTAEFYFWPKKRCRLSWAGFALLAVLLVLMPGTAVRAQEEARFSELVVANSQRDLLLFLKLEQAINKEMEAGVQNGLPITFTFETELDRVRSGWADKKIRAGAFEHTLAYDNLKKQYSVKKTENRLEVFVTEDFTEARNIMCEVNGYAVLPLTELEADQEYVLRVKATLVKSTLPLYFHYLIPFSDLWDLNTGWHEVKFRY